MKINKWKRSNIFRGGFSSYLDGKWHEYQGLDRSIDEIRDLVEDAFCYAERMAEENQELKDLHWENEQLQEMQKRIDYLETSQRHGFPIDEDQYKAIRAWEEQHWTSQHNAPDLESRLRKQGAIGGSFHYKFIPTSIGVSGCICCSACMRKALMNSGGNRDRERELIKEYDAEFEFQEIG